MQPSTVIRASAWIGVVVAGWSLNLRWGSDQMVRTGAPPQFERHVVGAALLVAIAALLIVFAGPKRAHGRRTAGVALAFAIGGHAIAWWIRSLSASTGQPHLVEGTGWMWLAAGTGLSCLAAIATLAMPKAKAKSKRR